MTQNNRMTPRMKTLARLVADARPNASVGVLFGSGSGPIKDSASDVWVGEHYWWGYLVPKRDDASSDDAWDRAIADWKSGRGATYTSRGEVAQTEEEVRARQKKISAIAEDQSCRD